MLDFKSGITMARMDSWCLGSTFFKMVTGRRPFLCKTKEELIANQLSSSFNMPQDFVHKDTVSSDYMTLIRNLCTVDPKSRISPAQAKLRLIRYKLSMLLDTSDRDEHH